MRRLSFACFPALMAVCTAWTMAGEPLRSGLQAGDKITAIFEPVNVNGEHAGEPYCLICENGLSPVAMLFAREANEPLWALIAKLDEATLKHREQELGTFVVFLSDSDKLRDRLAETSKQLGLKRTILCTFDPAGPEGFRVSRDADLTVVLYREHEVKANHALRKGELTAATTEKILSDLPKILTK